MIELVITGDADVQVEGACILYDQGGETVATVAAKVPLARRWPARAVRCEFLAGGRVTVEVSRDGSRTRTSSSGGRLVVELR